MNGLIGSGELGNQGSIPDRDEFLLVGGESTLALVPSGWESSDHCMNLNAHLYVVLRLRVHGAIPQFLMSSWYGA